jgi:hypothetical protein
MKITQKSISNAGHYLSFSDDEEIVVMIANIIDNENQDELIDYVDGVDVWEKVEFEFTCKEFLELIGLKK